MTVVGERKRILFAATVIDRRYNRATSSFQYPAAVATSHHCPEIDGYHA
jgi:hypothetical protein